MLDFLDGRAVFQWEEKDTHGEIGFVFQLCTQIGSSFGENRIGDLTEDTGAVTSFHIGIHSTTVSHVAHGFDSKVDNIVRPHTVDVGNGAHAAVIAFIFEAVQGTSAVGCGSVVREAHF